MTLKGLLTVIAGVFVLGMTQVEIAAAQTSPEPEVSGQSTTPTLMGRTREQGERRQRQPRQPTPAENLAQARALLTAAGSQCQAVEALPLGVTAEQQAAFEVVCTGAPGVIVIATTPPRIFNCFELAGQATVTRERDPAADVGQQCSNAANTDVLRYASAYAREAGVTCTVDQAAVIAKSSNGELIYEVGCDNADGFWINRESSGWKVNACWDLAIDNQTCRFTSPEERKLAWASVIGTTEAAGCDVAEARRVGRDAQGLTVYELKCASGSGYFVRVGADRLAQRAATCEASTTVAGGCKLTTAAAAPSPSPERQ